MALKVIYQRCLKPAWTTLNDRLFNIQTIPRTRWTRQKNQFARTREV